MGTKVIVGCTVLYTLLDSVITTVLYIHGSHLTTFTNDILDFNILRSALDLWGLMLLRVSLLLGASIGVSWNKGDGTSRVAKATTFILLICMIVITYSLAKLLMLTEVKPLNHQPWFLSLICWTCASSLGVVLFWKKLGKESNSVSNLNSSSRSGGGRGAEDTEKLVETAGEEDEEGEEGRQKKTSSGATLGRLLTYCKNDASLLSVAVLFLLISAVCEAFIPYYYGQAIDSIVLHQSMEYFVKPVITLAALALVSSLAMGVRGGVFTLTFARLNLRLRSHLFRTLMRQEIGFFDENHTGDIISRLSADTTQVSDLISQNINIFLRSIIKGAGFFVFMFGMSWKLTLVTIMGFPFIAFVSKLYGEYYKKLTKEVQTTLAEANKVAEETISSMRTVRSFANENGEADSYCAKLLVMFQLNKKQALAYACYMWTSCISELALEVAILYYGGHLVVTGQMSSGALISFFIYMLELGECLESIASVYTGLMQGVGAAEKVFEYLDRKPKHPAEGTEAPETCCGLVEFKDITFAYPTRPETDILKGVSFTLRPGEVTALVGPSGSGKSSCVSLLENFYLPQQGQVLLDGQPVNIFQHDYLHSKVALVGQEPVLFARTVKENIAYGLTDVSMEAVVQAATKANAHEFITALPEGYDTSVGEKGTQLSGGQKQRVAIARALIRNPRVLILDEATSALDAESEHTVQQALSNIIHEHTVLVIAHRLSTVEKADNIIVIDKGHVAEEGSHNQLMASAGLYCKLVQRQVLGMETGEEVLNPSENLQRNSDKRRRRRRQSDSSSSESEINVRYSIMGTKVIVGCTVLYTLLDSVITTVLYIHGSHLTTFTNDILDFNILRSALDLWGLMLLRVSLLLGASIGVSWNKGDGTSRVAKATTFILLICMIVITYSLAKLLMLTEVKPLNHQPWFLSLICWTCASSLGVVLFWKKLGKESNSVSNLNSSSRSGGGRGAEDTEKLVETAGEEDEEGEEGRQKKTSSGATLGRLLTYCKNDASLLSVAVLFLTMSAVCEAFIPYYFGKAIDSIVLHQSMEHFAKPVITLVILAMVSSFAIGVRGGVFTLTFARLNLRLRSHLFRTLMRQEIGFFDENHTGDIISRLSADTTQVSDLISQNINIFLRSIVRSAGFFVFMFGMSWKLTLVTIMGFPFITFVSNLYGEYYKKLAKEVQTTLAEANKVAEETISSMRTVRSFANESGEADSYCAKLLVMFQLNKKQALAYACYMWTSCMSDFALEIALLYYGGYLVVTGQMSSGTLISFVLYMLELVECLESIASVYTGLMQGVGAAEKVFEYLDRKPKHPAEGTEAPETCCGLVEFKDITFAYPTRPETDILKGVSFTLRPGEVTALVGPSGSGKSSCVNLLENFYLPQQGQVLLDGQPVNIFQHDYLHSKVALVGQEPVLFARTVKENIAYGLTDVSMEAVVQAATKANAHEFITALPEGYDTSVGEKGTQLSGGQKQRVAIARALIRNPRVLILDEATSALDAESEHIVQQALNNIIHEHTVLVIAHRLSTVEKADNIIVINKGHVAEEGSHNQLMASAGLYCKLVQRQVLGMETGEEVLNPSENLQRNSDKRRRHRRQSNSGSSESKITMWC
ncbi:ATP-binding cassette sub-family B member 9 [Melanotaenia boesemani]|uniref:ATP-binding cassette sub-family B member 9 n=1 Tax=Melanotaenia boesemani TaxID=1250792 RepID=UPI001C0571CF|nr:ATP-binding cassette sub-family B member 9 [Melanotaenia boesemani]